MLMKVETSYIITIDDLNYGNRLQNYATQMVLEKAGLNVKTIFYKKKALRGKWQIKLWCMRLSGYKLPGDKYYWKNFPKRIKKFEEFNKKNIKAKKIRNIKNVGQADFYIVGSDQVWNPEWYGENKLKKDLFLLQFVPPEKRVCMAPSFGVSELPDEWEEYFCEQLSRFPMLSVREQAGAELIYKLTGRTAEVIIDPTLMLDEADWLKIAQKPEKVDCEKKYILTYFLGGRTAEQDRYIRNIAQENDMEIYHLMDAANAYLYTVSPDEFLYLIKHAALVLTDSFHACVFSFLFNRPFLVYERNGNMGNMFSRIENLLDMLSLQRKHVGSGLPNAIFECEYSEGWVRLSQERVKAMEFLRKSMRIEK